MNATLQIVTAAEDNGWDVQQDARTRTITCRRGAVVFVATMNRGGAVRHLYRVVDNAATDVMGARDAGKLAAMLAWITAADDVENPVNQRPCPKCGEPQLRSDSTMRWWHQETGYETCAVEALVRCDPIPVDQH